MNFRVVGERELESFEWDKPWVLIQISSANDHLPIAKTMCCDRLKMCFLDLRKEGSIKQGCEERGLPVFNDEMAHQILTFFKYWKDAVDCVVVSCEVGISRSPAVAAALHEIDEEPEASRFYFEQYAPNPLVYQKLLHVQKSLAKI